MRFSEPLPLVLAAAKGEFNFPGPARWNLCISHRKRVQLNAQLNVLFKPEGAVFIPDKRKRSAQGAWRRTCGSGRGSSSWGVSEKKGVRNQVLYEVAEVNQNTVHFAGGVSLTHEQVSEWTVLSFAQTYASCQGTDFEGTLRLHDTTHKFFTRRHLFVGLSRAKASGAVDVRD